MLTLLLGCRNVLLGPELPRQHPNQGRVSGMPWYVYRAANSTLPSTGFSGPALLAILPLFAITYVLLILPFLPDDGKGRVENMLFWPIAASLALALAFQNRTHINVGFFRSPVIMTLIAYFMFAAASVTWAYAPDLSFTRLVVQVLAFAIVAVPFAFAVRTDFMIPALHFCYFVALAISTVYVLTTPPSPIGHIGYFSHKQELGLLGAVGLILSSHEILQSGWRRYVAICAALLAGWMVFESQSKSALALALFSIAVSSVMVHLCKKTRLSPAYFVAAIVLVSLFFSQPVERIGHRLYGDATLTGRTGIWGFIEYQISQKSWFGWGFHSYFFVPNSPHESAPGYIREMPSSHSGYMELRLETGYIGYWIFLFFIYASLHVLERVMRKDLVRAWCYLSIQLFAVMINLLDSNWIILSHFWLLYLLVVSDSVRYAISSPRSKPRPVRVLSGAVRWRRGQAVRRPQVDS